MLRIVRGALFILLAFVLCVTAHAQTPAIHPALFVVRSPTATIYLFGTVHVRRTGAAWGGPEAAQALAQSQAVRTELEMTPEADARAGAAAQRMGAAPTDDPLSAHLNAAQRQRLTDALHDVGLGPNALEAMRPWYAGVMLSLLPIMRAGYNPMAGVDRQIDAIADATHKEARWFETSEQQLNFIAHLSEASQVQMVMEGADAVAGGVGEMSTLEGAWERGDLHVLEDLVVDDTRRHYPELYEALFVARNRAWIDVLARDLQGGGTEFVAVGAGHLLGRDGLIRLLRARGYRVERVKPAE